MKLLSFPTEIFETILYHSIVARGIKRGLRLMLVNKIFASAVMDVIFSFRLLDNCFDEPRRFIPWALIQSYFAHRVHQAPIAGTPALINLQRIAREIYQHRNADDSEFSTLKSCIHMLCIRSSEIGRPSHFKECFQKEKSMKEEQYEGDLLAAAICTNCLTVVRSIFEAKRNPFPQDRLFRPMSFLFGRYLQLAGQYGNTELLEYLIPGDGSDYDKKMRDHLFEHAAIAGRLEIVRFIYEFKRMESPWEFEPVSSVHCITDALNTRSLEVLKFIERICATHAQNLDIYLTRMTESLEFRLIRAAQTGTVDITLLLLRLGADPQGPMEWHEPYRLNGPVVSACKYGNYEAAEILLEYGADKAVAIPAAASRGRKAIVQELLKKDGLSRKGALAKAAKVGVLDVPRMLLDDGVDVNESIGKESPLASAISLEHTALFNLLLERGANLYTEGTAEECVRRAKQDGLESMLDILKEQGISIDQ